MKLKITIFTYAYIKHPTQDLLVRIAKVRVRFFVRKFFQMTKKNSKSFLFRSYDQKYAKQKKFEKMNFLLLLRTECICVWYHCFWYQMKVKLICDKATQIQIKIIIQSKIIPLFVKETKSGKFNKPQYRKRLQHKIIIQQNTTSKNTVQYMRIIQKKFLKH